MKRSTFVCAVLASMVGASALSVLVSNAQAKKIVDAPITATTEPTAPAYPNDGMGFDVYNVVETFGIEETAWYMVYDDPDAGYNYEAIRIDKRTHDKIVNAQKMRLTLTGTLKATKPYESVEYVLIADGLPAIEQYASSY